MNQTAQGGRVARGQTFIMKLYTSRELAAARLWRSMPSERRGRELCLRLDGCGSTVGWCIHRMFVGMEGGR